jgi:hypothetical protein
MSLVRAFTTRGKKTEASVRPMGRAASHRNGKPVVRAQISSPVALVSTTNMLSYSAPDINGSNHRDFSSSTASSTSGEESDASTNSIHSNDTNTDMSSIDESSCPSPNHLSSYFKPAVDTSFNSPNQSPRLSALTRSTLTSRLAASVLSNACSRHQPAPMPAQSSLPA